MLLPNTACLLFTIHLAAAKVATATAVDASTTAHLLFAIQSAVAKIITAADDESTTTTHLLINIQFAAAKATLTAAAKYTTTTHLVTFIHYTNTSCAFGENLVPTHIKKMQIFLQLHFLGIWYYSVCH
jgi:hypothetical protein